MSTIEISELWKTFGEHSAIQGADLTVAEGEFVTLLGESGCGKTTTLRCIGGLETPTSGRISIGGRDVFGGTARTEVPPERRDIGMVFQSYALWPHLTVYGNVAYPLKRRKTNRADVRQRTLGALELVGLGHLADRPAGALSGGQQQRVALARAIVARPEVVLYDEPLSNLDPSLRRSMRDEIHRLHSVGGTTSVYVTHDLEEAMHLSDRVVLMQHGRLEQAASPRDIVRRPATEFVARFVGIENVLPATVLASSATSNDLEVAGLGVLRGVPSAQTGFTVGEQIAVALRGQSIELHREVNETAGDRAGILRAVTFLGARVEYEVECGGHLLKVVQTEGEARGFENTPVGETVGVRIVAELGAAVSPSATGNAA